MERKTLQHQLNPHLLPAYHDIIVAKENTKTSLNSVPFLMHAVKTAGTSVQEDGPSNVVGMDGWIVNTS